MTRRNRITPFLWFDSQAEEAADFYVSLFDSATVRNVARHGEGAPLPAGTAMTVDFDLAGQSFLALNGGPLYRFTPAVSFLVACRDRDELQSLWAGLAAGGTALMELGAYPFSELYGWIQDRFGLSWQVMHIADGVVRQRITPTLMFVGAQCGKAEEAIAHYASVFRDSGLDEITRYGLGEDPDRDGTVKHARFHLEGQPFAVMDSAYPHAFSLNESVSFLVHCDTQEEVDHYWGGLSADPTAERCGWLKDRYGLSWQIVPDVLGSLLGDQDAARAQRVIQAMLQMTKIDIQGLQRAYEGAPG